MKFIFRDNCAILPILPTVLERPYCTFKNTLLRTFPLPTLPSHDIHGLCFAPPFSGLGAVCSLLLDVIARAHFLLFPSLTPPPLPPSSCVAFSQRIWFNPAPSLPAPSCLSSIMVSALLLLLLALYRASTQEPK